MDNKESFPISPGTGMINVIGHSGYTFNYAIADLVDNCISAHAKNIMINFDLNCNNPNLYIQDDGDGMKLEELKHAAVIGFKDMNDYRDDDDLGRYSTGLKSATKSFCSSVVVSSKVKNEKANSILIDYDYIVNSDKWEAFIEKEFLLEGELKESGTIVYCEKINFLKVGFNKNNIYERLDDLEKSLSHIFGKYIISNRITLSLMVKGSKPIIINGWNPFKLVDNKSTKKIYDNHDNPTVYHGYNIDIKAYILPVYDNLSKIDQDYMKGKGLLEQEGFYVFRNDRLIKEGGWLDLPGIGLDEKCKYARIEVNIPTKIDKDFEINFSKNSLVIPDELKPLFIDIAKKARKESRNNFNYQKHPELKRKTKQENEMIWKNTKTNNGIVLSINNNHPLIKELSKGIPEKNLKVLLNTIAKSLPITMIQSQITTTTSYTENELFEMMESIYGKLKLENLEEREIKKKMVNLEPFKDYRDILAVFFDDKGV